MATVPQILGQISLETLAIPFVTALGCITAFVYSEQKGIKASLSFWRNCFPARSEAFYFRVDFVMSALVGTGIGLILYSPHTPHDALLAGIGWTAAFNLVKAERKTASSRG